MENRLKLVGSILNYILSGLIIAAIILVAVGQVRIAVVEGISMEPTFHTGDMVFLEKKSPSDIRVGDVIVYTTGSKYIIHRVIKVSRT
jgi:signal peptidase